MDHCFCTYTRLLPHFNERPAGTVIDTLIVHSMFASGRIGKELDAEACVEVLDEHCVAAHFIIARDGSVWRVVPEEKRAWHAGESALPNGRRGVNDFSIGIELIGTDNEAFDDLQYQSLAALTTELLARYPLHYILGHEHVALPPGRKTDPGPYFDWERYRALLLRSGADALALIFPASIGVA